MTFSYVPDEAEVRREKSRARALRASQWWKRRLARGICHYCRKPFPPKELTMDHIVPIALGGKSTRGNVVPCCKACNIRKKSTLLMDWEESGGPHG